MATTPEVAGAALTAQESGTISLVSKRMTEKLKFTDFLSNKSDHERNKIKASLDVGELLRIDMSKIGKNGTMLFDVKMKHANHLCLQDESLVVLPNLESIMSLALDMDVLDFCKRRDQVGSRGGCLVTRLCRQPGNLDGTLQRLRFGMDCASNGLAGIRCS
mmetsp:Transcript_34925/g.63937  ORF Transcript_34925/g.63937 Transcript_34925/m.63937 type:complete len:161 (-) Transcript_34925:14-496(-)